MEWVWDVIEDIIDPCQFGTVAGSYTTHALVELVHHWLSGLDESGAYVRA